MPDLANASPDEMHLKGQWVQRHLLSSGSPLPFSFRYDGKDSGELLAAWPKTVEQTELNALRRQHTATWADPDSGLEVKCVVVEYRDFPVVEWTVHLKNTGENVSPVLSEFHALDVSFPEWAQPGNVALHHHKGDTCGADAFAPQRLLLERNSSHRFAPTGGRPTNMCFPYFNLESLSAGAGRIVVLGWPGQWSAEFTCDEKSIVRVRGGQETLNCRLNAGRAIRAPLVVQLFWKRAHVDAQNLFRRWMLAHNLPRCNGDLHPPFSAQCMGTYQNEKDEKQFIDALSRNDAKMDYWWMDAGWWKEGFPATGNWESDTVRFPGGIRPVSDHARSRGMKLVLWFEPERVSPGLAWGAGKVERWLLAIPPEARRERIDVTMNAPKFTLDEAERNQMIVGDRLLNLGNAEARAFLRDFLSAKIVEWGIDFLRFDFNISPLAFWRAADEPNRLGLTENHYASGWLTLLDELRARHPDLWIDTCASGGRRIDLETLRRTLPLLRSDYQFEPVGNQGHTLGLASWVPFFGTGAYYDDTYIVRSSMSTLGGIGYQTNKGEIDWNRFRLRLAEWKKVAPYFLGDFYPLTEHTLNNDAWMAWQFDRPDLKDGVIQIFRREKSPFERACFKLHGLDPAATYEILDVDRADFSLKLSGQELSEVGLAWELKDRRSSAILIYKRHSTGGS